MIEVHLLEQLVAFAQCGTLSAAAEKLHTSQPALTRSMKKLETLLDVTLFVRSKNRLVLNECGKLAVTWAGRVLEENREFERRVKAYDRSFHTQPQAEHFFWKKCGHEDLYISLPPENPLALRPQVRLADLDGMSILLLSRIGFWANTHRAKTPNAKYLLQIEKDSFWEFATNSSYPVFESGYRVRHGQTLPGRINVPLVDSECHTDYYLVSLASEQKRFAALFDHVNETTIL